MRKTYCFFSARYLPYLGGVERYTYNMAKELVLAGNKVIIITSLIGNEPVFEENSNITIYRLPSLRLLNGRFPVVRYNMATRKVLAAVSAKQIDYVIINTRFYPLSYVGAVFSKKKGKPAIIIEHGTGHFTVNNKVFDFVGHIYEHLISDMIKRNVKDYYGVSQECNKWLKHFKITARGILYNSVDKNQIESIYQLQNKKIENQIQYEKKDIIITFTGRLIKEKGILKLITAFKNIRKKYANIKLCIAGDGDLYDIIWQESYDGVYLLGKLSFESVISLLRLTTIFCLPTDYPEGLPTSVLEAIICQCYVVTSAVGGAKEIITDSTYGTILMDNDVKEIESALLETLSNSDRRVEAIRKSYEKVCNQFIWRKTANKLIEIFEK